MAFHIISNLIADYIIIDATTVIENDIKKKFEIITENYRLHLYVTKEMEKIHGKKKINIKKKTIKI